MKGILSMDEDFIFLRFLRVLEVEAFPARLFNRSSLIEFSVYEWFMNRLVVVLERKTYIHDLGSLTLLHTIDTVPNVRGPFTYIMLYSGCFEPQIIQFLVIGGNIIYFGFWANDGDVTD